MREVNETNKTRLLKGYSKRVSAKKRKLVTYGHCMLRT